MSGVIPQDDTQQLAAMGIIHPEPCLESVEDAESVSLKTPSSAETAGPESELISETELEMKKEIGRVATGWGRVDSAMTPKQVEVIQALLANNGDLNELYESGFVSQSVIGYWVRSCPAFKSYWSDIHRSTMVGAKMAAMNRVSKEVTAVGKMVAGASLKERLQTINTMMKIATIKDEDEDSLSGKEMTKITQYDSFGKIMSVTEQTRVLNQIRAKREKPETLKDGIIFQS